MNVAASAPMRIAIVGAGWAGLAAAIALVERFGSVDDGHARITLHDAAPQAGGRARGIDVGGFRVDNGQHLIVGAYTELQRLMTVIGQGDIGQGVIGQGVIGHGVGRDGVGRHTPAPGWDRRAMTLGCTDGFRFAMRDRDDPLGRLLWRYMPAALPALALVEAQGIDGRDRLALVRALVRLRLGGFRPPAGVATVVQWWHQAGQTPRLIDRLWRPLAVGTMNTDPDAACARTFLNVLRDTLGAPPSASDFLLARGTLSDLFVEPALQWLVDRGVQWRPRSHVTSLADPTSGLDADAVIVATPPSTAARLLDTLPAPADSIDHADPADRVALDALVADLRRLDYRPITTVWCAWPASDDVGLPAVVQLAEDAGRERFGQWLFDRGVQRGHRIAGIVISDSERALAGGPAGDHAALCESVVQQLGEELQLARPAWTKIITDRRATFACTPDRPLIEAGAVPGHRHVTLAGDYAWPDYPATLESALRSGVRAARGLECRRRP